MLRRGHVRSCVLCWLPAGGPLLLSGQVVCSHGITPGPQVRPAGSCSVVGPKRHCQLQLHARQPALPSLEHLLSQLCAVLHRPAVAVAMLPLFLPRWPQLVACLWDPSTPQLAAAAAPLLGIVGALVASSRAAAATADAASTPSAQAEGDSSTPASTSPPAPAAAALREDTRTAVSNEPPPPPASLLFDWLVPLLTGAVPLPTGVPAPLQLQALICKTLAYALQQLPSTTSTAGAAATTTTTGTDSTTTPPHAARAQQDQQGPRQVQPGPQAAGTSGQPGPAAAGAGKGSRLLLTVPVPPAAAEQLQQHAAGVMRAVQQLLEAVSTPPELLGPLLQLLLEVVRLAHTVITGTHSLLCCPHTCLLPCYHTYPCAQGLCMPAGVFCVLVGCQTQVEFLIAMLLLAQVLC